MRPTEYLVRREHPGDEPAIRHVHETAFARSAEADLVDRLRADGDYVAELSRVAVAPDGAVIGHALFARVLVGGSPALSLAPLAVVPGWQDRGVGSALVQSGLEKAEQLGEPLVIVLGRPSYYRRFGFRPATELAVVNPYGVPDEAFQAIALDAYDGTTTGSVTLPAGYAVLE